MTRSPNDEGDEVTRQKMQAMAKDGSLRVTSDGAPSSAPTNETGPAMRPGFLSTDQYNMGLAIVSGEKAPLTRDPPRPAAGHAAPPKNAAASPSPQERAARDAPTDVHVAAAPPDATRARNVVLVVAAALLGCALLIWWLRASGTNAEETGSIPVQSGAPLTRLPTPTSEPATLPTATATVEPTAQPPSNSAAATTAPATASTSPTPSATAAAPRLTSSAAATAPPSSTAPYDPGDLMFKRKKNP